VCFVLHFLRRQYLPFPPKEYPIFFVVVAEKEFEICNLSEYYGRAHAQAIALLNYYP